MTDLSLPSFIARGLAAESPAPDRPPQPDPLFRKSAVVFGRSSAKRVSVLADRDDSATDEAYLVCDHDALVDVEEVR